MKIVAICPFRDTLAALLDNGRTVYLVCEDDGDEAGEWRWADLGRFLSNGTTSEPLMQTEGG